jgi:L-ascorbate metabolism protein UlaG (beta-lactamase superfamily)
MQLTKLTHSCVRVDTGAGVLVLDPGAYSEAAQALDGADACLITHLHADHLDAHAVAAALRAQPDLRVWPPASALDVLRSALGDHASDRLTAVGPDERFDVFGTPVRTYGGQHALNHSSIPMVANVGYRYAATFTHLEPGESSEL